MWRFDRRLLHHFDWVLLLMLLLISAMALLNLHSSTLVEGRPGFSATFYKQLYVFLAGLCLIPIILSFDYRELEPIAYILYVVINLLLLYTVVSGTTIADTNRWIRLGAFNLQPSEPAKIIIVMVLASCFAAEAPNGGYRIRDLIRPLVLTAIPFLLIAKQPDLGTAMMLAIIFCSMLPLLKLRWSTIYIIIGSGLAVLFTGWKFLLKDYQRQRIETFLNPESDPMSHGYQVMQSKIAVGSGGLEGRGFLEGTQGHLHFLPERHTDFAFAVWAEEWGFAGTVFFLGCYLFMLLWGINIAISARDKFGVFLAFGMVVLIFWQLVINLFMITGCLPVVGIPLPFFSYGGSSLLTGMGAIAVLINIRVRRFMTPGNRTKGNRR